MSTRLQRGHPPSKLKGKLLPTLRKTSHGPLETIFFQDLVTGHAPVFSLMHQFCWY